MSEPFYIRQFRGSGNADMRAFVEQCSDEARAEGAKHCRATQHPDDDLLIVFEGWKERPADEGDARFQMVAAEN